MRPTRSFINIVIGLWCLHGVTLTAATVAQVSPGLVADLAKDKGIIWLALTTAIMAISANVWLVKQLIRQSAKSSDAINRVANELERRPCFYNTPEDK